MSAAVIPHSDEHLKCQDPFQQLCTSNQALSSVTTILQPLPSGPHDFSLHCVWRQGMWEDTNKHRLWEGRPGCWGPGRRERPELGDGGGGHLLSRLPVPGGGRKGHHMHVWGIGSGQGGETEHPRFPSFQGVGTVSCYGKEIRFVTVRQRR